MHPQVREKKTINVYGMSNVTCQEKTLSLRNLGEEKWKQTTKELYRSLPSSYQAPTFQFLLYREEGRSGYSRPNTEKKRIFERNYSSKITASLKRVRKDSELYLS
jgi:hypothetical protein